MSFIFSDAGRIASGFSERRDCVVRAFATVANCEYRLAHDACESHGRKSQRGMTMQGNVQGIADAIGIGLQCVRRSGSLRRLIADYPIGRLLVTVSGHAFAVIDGAIIDNAEQSLDRIVKGAWLVK